MEGAPRRGDQMMDGRGSLVKARGRLARPSALEWRVFESSPASCKQAREWIAAITCRNHRDINTADVALAVSEFLANAITHGPEGGHVLVGCCLTAGVRIVVCDEGGQTDPRLRSPGPLEEGGRGLRMVDALSMAWGHFRAGHVQVVWCDLGEELDPVAEAEAWTGLARVLDMAFRPASYSGTVIWAG